MLLPLNFMLPKVTNVFDFTNYKKVNSLKTTAMKIL